MSSRALNSNTLTVRAKITRLAALTVSFLFSHNCDTLSFEGARNSNGLALWTIVSDFTFKSSWIR